jgi:hypothetical protein
MDIHSLIGKMASLDGAVIGRGPRHPTNPDPDLAPVVEKLFVEYPFLRKDQGYVDFIECYAGAFINSQEDDLVIDIFGLSNVSTNLLYGEGDIIDEDGFLTICDIAIGIDRGPGLDKEIIGIGFSFDATQSRQPGIYRYLINAPVDWYCKTFLELLDAIIEKRGRLF